MANEIKYLTVTALNSYIGYMFEKNPNLTKLYVQGEISNLRESNGHLYFSLKDENSEISAIMFRSMAAKLKFTPIDGMTCLVEASCGVFQKKGTYNLNVTKMAEVGLGQAYIDFLRLKEKLSKEGLFDEKYKLPIKEYPEHIGVVTSATGDALHDITSTISKRFPIATVYLYPCLVQGQDASRDLVRALNEAYKNEILDVIIIGRGGGSVEDLSCFNDELLARTIFKSKIPVVSAVGHEQDYTICDFVSSFRAPTPTGAAVRVSKDKYTILSNLDSLELRMETILKNIITNKEFAYMNAINNVHFKHFDDKIDKMILNINNIQYNLNRLSPINQLNININMVNDLSKRLELINLNSKIDNYMQQVETNDVLLDKYYNKTIEDLDSNLDSLINKMILINPLNILKKGYALTYKDNTLIKSRDQLEVDDEIKVILGDGTVTATVKSKGK